MGYVGIDVGFWVGVGRSLGHYSNSPFAARGRVQGGAFSSRGFCACVFACVFAARIALAAGVAFWALCPYSLVSVVLGIDFGP